MHVESLGAVSSTKFEFFVWCWAHCWASMYTSNECVHALIKIAQNKDNVFMCDFLEFVKLAQ
jgi:hypothetical protein